MSAQWDERSAPARQPGRAAGGSAGTHAARNGRLTRDRARALQRSAGNRAVGSMVADVEGPADVPDVTVHGLIDGAAFRATTGSRVRTRGGNNPELLELDTLLDRYRAEDDQTDPQKQTRFDLLYEIERKVYEWYDRRHDVARPTQSRRRTALLDLLDQVAVEFDSLTNSLVSFGARGDDTLLRAGESDQVVQDLPIPTSVKQDMSAEAIADVQRAWRQLVSETGGITFSLQNNKRDESYPDFKKKMLPIFAKLLRTHTGQQLTLGLLDTTPGGLTDDETAKGYGKVTVRPTGQAERDAGRVAAVGVKKSGMGHRSGDAARAGGGRGIGSYLSTSPVDGETDVTRRGAGHDVRGHDLLSPNFIILGHEMIHVLHNLRGQNRNQTALDEWDNEEEKATISGLDRKGTLVEPINEQALRREYGLNQVRHGH